MTLRLAGLAALALLSSACAFTSPATVQQPVDYSDYAAYDQAFGASPNYRAATETSPVAAAEAPATEAAPAKSGNTLGTVDSKGAGNGRAGTVAVPGDPCYEAAAKAGITRGECTMLNDREYILFGDR